MADVKILAFNCLNPECGQIVKIKRPEKSGVYDVVCPHCNVSKKLKLTGLDSFQEPGDTTAASDNSDKPEIEVKGIFRVGEECKVTCPHCNTQVFGFKPQKPGMRVVPCPSCKGKCKIDVIPKTEMVIATDMLQPYNGKLTHIRRGWVNKSYYLNEGANTIGRYDEDKPSDISIKNDSTMSRRSVRIDVKNDGHGYSFKLTVLRAANAITHNGTELNEGECISLNFGDILILGKTKLRFDREE